MSGPLLKWVGGKRQLLPVLRRYYPQQFGAYIEPFFGSGAVFFNLWQRRRLEGHKVVLIDSNPDLIGCYQAVRDSPDAVADELEQLADAHARDGRAHYYFVRDSLFNPLRAGRRSGDGAIAYTPALAAMFIYLNRTGFNGLFRVNARGGFNVPAGRYERPRIADRPRLHDVARALGCQAVTLRYGSFGEALTCAEPGDFLYVDPPYAPLSHTASFTAYTTSGFGETEQWRLQRMVIELAGRGCHLLVSNSTAAVITDLYNDNADASAAGLRAFRVPARRAVNSNATRRGPVDEYVITNVGTDAGSDRVPQLAAVRPPRARRTADTTGRRTPSGDR